MDRKGILGLILVVSLFAGWNVFYIRKSQEAATAQRLAEEARAAEAASQPKPVAPAAADPTLPPVSGTPAPPLENTPQIKEERLANSIAEYIFTNVGGGLRRATLFDHKAEKESRVVLNQYGTIPIGAVSGIEGAGLEKAFTVSLDEQAGKAVLERTDERQVQLVKTFTLPQYAGLEGAARLREEYLLTLDLSFNNRGNESVEVPPYFVHAGSAAPIHQHDQAIYTGFNYFRGGGSKSIDVTWFQGGGFLFFKGNPRPVYPETPEKLVDVRWAGVTNQYFSTVVTALVDEKAMSADQVRQRGDAVWARRFEVGDEAWRNAGHSLEDAGERGAIDGAIGMPGFRLQPGETVTRNFQIYAGPREHRRLRELGNYQDEIMDFGIFSIVSRTLLNSMNFLKGALGNYAFAIILLTLVIKTAMWPLQNKATASMKKMQALQPKMNEMREKYKDDPQVMNTEVMKLYKEYGVNPFGGCLPMLVQIPIFFGFYNMLGKAVELRNAKFLWVDDLSQPDTITHLLGLPVNVLPLLMAATMLWSMALQPKSGDAMQQRVFMFVPLIFIFFCYNFASALALYWTVQNLFSVVQSYVTRNQTAPILQKVTVQKPKR